MMKSKMFMSMLVIVLAAALVGGATMAWFTSAAANAPNTFAAGTVVISADRGLGEPLPGPMFYTTLAEGQVGPLPPFNPTGPWFPGMTVTRNLEVRNIGTLQVRLNQVSAAIYSINGLPPALNPALAAGFLVGFVILIFLLRLFTRHVSCCRGIIKSRRFAKHLFEQTETSKSRRIQRRRKNYENYKSQDTHAVWKSHR